MNQRSLSRRDRFPDPFDARRSFFNDFINFNRLWQDPERWSGINSQTVNWIPPVESYLDMNQFHVRIALAGVKPEDVNVQVHGHELIVTGERKQESEPNDEQTFQYEFSYGAFARVIPLPEGVEGDKIEANYRNGVLQITASVSEKSLPRRIEIKGDITAGSMQKLAA